VSAVVEWLKQAPSVNDLRWEIEKAAAIRAWCLRQVGVGEGDRVLIRRDLGIHRASGWWPYREALAEGATGTVVDIDFNPYSDDGRGAWQAQVRLDREWSYSETLGQRFWHGRADETPQGYEPPSSYERENYPDGRRHVFAIRVDDLEVVGRAS
jgi:hypothetical protein